MEDNLQLDKKYKYLTFYLDNKTFALPLHLIERIILVIEMTPLPNAPDIIMGVINLYGRIIPVADLRKRFHFDDKALHIEDYIIVGRTTQRSLGIRVDNVGEIITGSKDDVIEQKDILPDIAYVKGVVKLNGNIILIHDLEQCLSLDEHKEVSEAVEKLGKSKNKKRK